MSGRLEDRIAVVTGGAGGIGAAVAASFSAEGARVLIADRHAERGAEVAQALGARLESCPTELTSEASVAALFERAASLGPVSILVNAAGGSGRAFGDGPVAECTEEGWDWVLNTNLKSVYLCCKHAIPLLRKAGTGSIVNVASVLGLAGHPLFATHAYAAAKGGVIALTRAMAVTYAKERIRANVVCPGLIDTPMSARAAADPQIQAALADLQPLTGSIGRPRDVAEAALFFAADSASFITGCVLPVDGGWTAQ